MLHWSRFSYASIWGNTLGRNLQLQKRVSSDSPLAHQTSAGASCQIDQFGLAQDYDRTRCSEVSCGILEEAHAPWKRSVVGGSPLDGCYPSSAASELRDQFSLGS